MTIKQIIEDLIGVLYIRNKIKKMNVKSRSLILLDSIKDHKYYNLNNKERELEEEKEYFIMNSFVPGAEVRKRYFKKYKKQAFKDYFLQSDFYTIAQSEEFNTHLVSPCKFIDISLGKNIEYEKNLVLYSINKNNGNAILFKKNQYNKEKPLYKHSFYCVILDSLDKISYIIPNRLKDLMESDFVDPMLINELNYQFNKLDLNVYFSSAGEWLNIYPSEIVKQQIVENENLIIDFCNKRDLMFCYSEKYEYDKKLKKHVQKIDSIDPKLGFIKKESFDDWISMDVFTPKTITNDGIFYQYRTVREKEKDEFLIEHIFVQQFKNFKTKIKNIEQTNTNGY